MVRLRRSSLRSDPRLLSSNPSGCKDSSLMLAPVEKTFPISDVFQLECSARHQQPPGKETTMRSRLLLGFVVITLFVCPVLAQKRNITEKDLFNFVWAADPQIAPDGSRVAFVRVTVNARKDGDDTAIWSVCPATGA